MQEFSVRMYFYELMDTRLNIEKNEMRGHAKP